MDGWQKLEVVSKVLAAIFIPLTVAYLGNQVATSNKQRDSETRFVELATAILSQNPAANPAPENKNLRQWAVAVINRFSGVPMPDAAAQALISQQAYLPQVQGTAAAAAPPATDPAGTWGLVFGGDATLEAARHEVTVTAERMGIGPAEIFRRAGSFRSVKVLVSRASAEDALGKARSLRPDAYIVNMSLWCPTSAPRSGYFECGAS